jgi:hypothetical protein
MMGGVSPETCWASYKYGIIKFRYIVASCWIFLYELYYNARIHELQEENDYIKGLNVLWHWGVNLLSIYCVPLYDITGKCKPKWLERKGRNFNVSSTNSGTYKYNILRQVTV